MNDSAARLPKGIASPTDGRAARRAPGEPELWIFLIGDLIVFAVFFAIWSLAATHQPEIFSVGKAHAARTLALVNTIALLTSSWAAASAVVAARRGQPVRASRGLAAAMALGALFVAVKAAEYTQKINLGVDVQGNVFDMYYFVFTGIHLAHVLVGLMVLHVARRRYLRPRDARQARGDLNLLEGAASYWHIVDVLWLVLFLLIYQL